MAKRKPKDIEEALEALTTLVMTYPQTRVKLAMQSLYFYAWYYFNVVLYKHQKRWGDKLLKSRRALILGPAGHGKTELISKIIPAWLICKNRNSRNLFVSDSGGATGTASKNAMLLKQELETNPRLIEDFGPFHSTNPRKCKVWQQTIFQVIRDKKMKDATVQSIGILESITGGRFDNIIFDDIVDKDSARSATKRKNILEEVMTTLIPRLEPNGIAWMIGTRKHFDDIYSHLIKNPSWDVMIDRAIIREPEDWEIIKLEDPIIREDGSEQWHKVVIHSEDKGECFCEQLRSMEELLLLRYELTPRFFNPEYQNEITDDETSDFKLAWLEQCRNESKSYIAGRLTDEIRSKYIGIFVGIDPSLAINKQEAEVKDTSYMVQIALGLTRDGTRELLAMDRFRGLSPADKMERVKSFYYRIFPTYCAAETNSFGTIYHWNLVNNHGMKIFEHKTGLNKTDPTIGVPSLSILFQHGKIILPYKTPEDKQKTDTLINEFHSFGSTESNDIVMATWIADTLIERYLAGQARKRKQKNKINR